MTKYVLTMTEEQARITVAALDFATRVWLGQWKEIIECCLPFEKGKLKEYCERTDEAAALLLQARNIVMPELREMNSLAGSYGVYSSESTERAFNVLLAVRSCLAWHKKPEGGYTVDFRKPMAIHIAEPMPECEAVEDET